MKSKTSCFSKTIFRKNITHFWPIWSLLLIFYLFLLPFMEFVNYLETKGGFDAGKSLAQRMEESVLLPELTQMVINPTLLFLFSLIVAGALFSYLYTSRAAYTMHAFPVTRTSLFFSNYLSGLLFLWMPLLTGGLFGILMAAGCGYSYLDILFKGLLMAMGISFFFYNFHVLVAMCIGQLIALPIFAFILNFLFVGCKFILIVLFASFSYGLNGEYVPGKLDVLSPLYYMSGKIRAVINYSSGLDHSVCTGIEGGTVVAGYALAAVVLIVIAYLLYRRRHLETAGNLISFSWILPVFRWGVGACFASLGSLFGGSIVAYYASATAKFMAVLIAGIIVGAVFFFAAEMVLQKSFRVFVRKRVKECGFFVLTLAVVLIFLKMDVFGIEGKVPDTSAVKEAYIRANECVGGDSEEDIDRIIALHETILSHKAEYQNSSAPWDEDSLGISVKYFMKNGSVLNRYYVVPAGQEQLSDENSAASMVKEYSLAPERYKKSVLGVNYKENRYTGGSLDILESVGVDEDGNGFTSNSSRDLTPEQAKALCEAFIKDVEAGNFDKQWENTVRYEEEYRKNVYYNSLSLVYTNEKGYENFSDKFYRDSRYYYVQDMANAYITFNQDCENIIHALLDTGVIKSTDELITLWDMERKEAEAK